MDRKIKLFAALILGLFIAGMSTETVAQDIMEAQREMKSGIQKKREENYPAAIESFGNCIDVCNQLGSEANEVLKDAQKRLVKTHLDYGNSLFEKEEYDNALTHYNKAIELGEEYKQESYVTKAKNNLPQVFYAKGKKNLENENYTEAINQFNKAIEKNPDYGWAYIRKAQAYQKIGKTAEFKKSINTAVEVGKKTEHEKVVKTADGIAYQFFANKGVKALKAKDYASAAQNLEEATNHNGSPKIVHYLAMSYGKIGEYKKAIEKENKVIEALKGEKSKEELAQYYYSLAQYYQKDGQKAEACSAYKNAAYGKYKKNAEYQIKYKLKCQ
jgi:tetratricopeptide (TPR) repeat protein